MDYNQSEELIRYIKYLNETSKELKEIEKERNKILLNIANKL